MTYLRDITVSLNREKHTNAETRPKTREFNLSTNCVTSMFLFELGNIEIGAFQKIIIEISPTPDLNCQDDMVDVLKIEAGLDIDTYLNASANEKKSIILEIIYERLLWLFKKRDWDISQIIRTYTQCQDKNIKFVLTVGKKKNSPDRRYLAQLEINYGINAAIIQVRLTRSNSDDSYQIFELCRSEPHEIRILPLLGKTKWTSRNEFTLWSKDKTKHWNIKINND